MPRDGCRLITGEKILIRKEMTVLKLPPPVTETRLPRTTQRTLPRKARASNFVCAAPGQMVATPNRMRPPYLYLRSNEAGSLHALSGPRFGVWGVVRAAVRWNGGPACP